MIPIVINIIVLACQISLYSNVFYYDLSGNVLDEKEWFVHSGGSDYLRRTYSYDSRGCVISSSADMNEGRTAVITNTYDERGHITQRLYCDTASDNDTEETMSYNLQGLLTSKANGFFDMTLRYHTPQHSLTAPSFAGNITEWEWNNGTGSKTYAFSYDALSRLTDARQYSGTSLTDSDVERGLTYDKNSNIQSLQRYHNGALSDNLNISYLDGVRRNGYTYDLNGNVTYDGINNLEISYNVLNLADSIGGNVHYEYLADGTKLAARDATGNGYLYKGSLVYLVNNGALTLKSAAFDGGRFIDGEMHYFFTDHLGSTRAAITISESEGVAIVERNDYYPFGKRYGNTTQPTADNLFRFSGKELQHIGSLTTPYYDFGARLYDPNGAAWLHPDPLAEKYYGISPYAYCAGNPIKFVDEDGKQPGIAFYSRKEAALNWGNYYNGQSILIGAELGSSIYIDIQNNKSVYIYTEPTIGNSTGVTPSPAPKGKMRVATIHSHSKYEKGFLNNDFSKADKDNAEVRKAHNYVSTPNGSLKEYNYQTKKETNISNSLPSDPADPARQNLIPPTNIPLEKQRALNSKEQSQKPKLNSHIQESQIVWTF